MKLFPLAVLFLLLGGNESKVISPCYLAQMLHEAKVDGFGGVSLADWICFATHGSKLNSGGLITYIGGYRNYGIFQLTNTEHCHDTAKDSENICKTCCVYFLNEDLSDDIECLKRHIMVHGGLKSWSAWRDHCRDKNVHHYIEDCGLDIKEP
nr:lysozyme C, milk isozyme-like [Anolis sagrei ordinatus]